MTEQRYCKRLIEVDLPIKKISEHARKEKSVRHGHISTLHIWWARRPLAACRSVICAALWPDPADPLCPKRFNQEAARLMKEFRDLRGGKQRNWDNPLELRHALLDFISDFANWDNSTVKDFLETSRKLTQIAHESLGGVPGTKPLIIDPFAGGGSIPLEALRVGADAFASDLNPIPVLLNKVVLEYIPKYGQRLGDEVRKWGEWIKNEAKKELAEFYPKDSDGAIPMAYLWARTIQCEGPGCGAEVPLMRSFWLSKHANRSVALQVVPNSKLKRVDFRIINKQKDGWFDQSKTKIENPTFDGTAKRGSVSCPCCGYTTPVARVREQLKKHLGGANHARLTAVVVLHESEPGRFYRVATQRDLEICSSAEKKLHDLEKKNTQKFSLVPTEPLPLMSGVFNAPIYGHNTWGSLFTHRQALSLVVLSKLASEVIKKTSKISDDGVGIAAATVLSLAISKHADLANALCAWEPIAQCPRHLFGRQAIGMVWDFAEGVAIGDSSGSALLSIDRTADVLDGLGSNWLIGHTEQASASSHPLPDDSAQILVTDPPYYNAVPYADLSDFFYLWLRRILSDTYPSLFKDNLAPKDEEICEMSGWDPVRYAHKTSQWFEEKMKDAMSEARRVVEAKGIGIVVFAHKSTSGWEAQLQAILDAGWVVTASWPIDTECGSRLRAMNSAALGSSIHIVMRPRKNSNNPLRTDEIGDWRDVLQELPNRIHEWMPRLSEEGVVGADAIFACLGPALEIYSKYSRVEKANGDKVELREYLEQVWGAVAKEALNMIFQGAHTEGFEEDARLTAMWLWTLSAGSDIDFEDDEETLDDADSGSGGMSKSTGFSLEFDAARKIAQGLGAHLENLSSIIEINGDQARLLPVAERMDSLFGKGSAVARPVKRKNKENQMALFEELEKVETQGWSLGNEKSIVGKTILDRLHQAMLLFGAGRADAMRRFLVEEGIGKDERFWRLAQALSALYPSNTDEKRWVDGVLARKKSLGF